MEGLGRSYKDLLSQQYLEYLVHVSKTEVEKYHTQLAIRYLEIMISASSSAAGSAVRHSTLTEIMISSSVLLKFHSLLPVLLVCSDSVMQFVQSSKHRNKRII